MVVSLTGNGNPLGGSGGFAGAFSKVGFELFSLLPDAAAARGLSAAAAAQGPVSDRIEINPDLKQAARIAEQRAKDLDRIRGKLDTVTRIVERARDKLDEIRLLLVDARKAVTLAQGDSADDDEKRTQAGAFDQALGKINIKVRNFGTIGNNLLGSRFRDVFEADEITFPIRPNSLVEDTITGFFAGSDFTITEDGTGDIYAPDIFGSKVQTLPIPIDEDPDDGITLLDDDTIVLDNDTGAVSITRDGEGTPVLEGTLERHGLGVLFSPFYGSFLDDAALDTALSDVDDATGTVRFLSGIFDGYLGRVRARRDQVVKQIRENERIVGQVQTETLRQQLEAQAAQQRNELLFSSALRTTLSFTDSGVLTTAINNLVDVQV